MPRILVYEFICGGALADQPLPDSLAAEGWAMLSAVVKDFGAIDGTEVWTTLDSRIHRSLAAEVKEFRPQEERDTLLCLASNCDYVLVIAPETDGILYERAVWLADSPARWLGCSPSAIELTADKFKLGNHLKDNGIPALAVQPLLLDALEGLEFPVVIKPRDGAGSESTFLVPSPDELLNALSLLNPQDGELVHQSLHPGEPVSVAFLCGPAGASALPPCNQHLSDDGRFRYLGGRVPLEEDLAVRATSLAAQALRCLDGLSGHVGVDLLLGSEPQEDRVVEVNPRMTTSYVGLRQAVDVNLAEQLLAIVEGAGPSALRARKLIAFQAEGSWSELSPEAEHLRTAKERTADKEGRG